jgi:hypothetical protein
MQINGVVLNDHVGATVRDYRTTLAAAFKDETTQLKAARESLQEAYKSGDKTAVDAAKLAVEGIQQDRQANRAAAKTVHGDVAELRGARKQLAADVKANNVDAIQQDIDAATRRTIRSWSIPRPSSHRAFTFRCRRTRRSG